MPRDIYGNREIKFSNLRVGGIEGETVTSHFSVLNVRPLDVANSPTCLICFLQSERLLHKVRMWSECERAPI